MTSSNNFLCTNLQHCVSNLLYEMLHGANIMGKCTRVRDELFPLLKTITFNMIYSVSSAGSPLKREKQDDHCFHHRYQIKLQKNCN